jgi:hypothetical protein
MDFTGCPMRGFIDVAPGGTRDGRALRKWLAEGVEFARTIAVAGPPRRRRGQGKPPTSARARRPG